jgi:ABC-type antimicrobial peptide transport system permease subunit
MTVYVRTTRPSGEAFSAIRRTVGEIDASLPLFDLNTMEDQLDRSLSLHRLVAFLSASFGFLATGLCVIGLYGVTAYTVARRMREFGILMAFGAQSRDVIGKVLRECAILATMGIVLGLPMVWWLSGLVESQLFGVQARDPYTYAGVALLLLTVAALAGMMPAWRASRVNPWVVLRYE